MSKKERWKNVVGYEGYYKVSNWGRVKSLRRNQMMSTKPDNHGYSSVGLCKNGKSKSYRVHRLVATAFMPNPKGLPWVNHEDGNKLNNHRSNLKWCTPSYNCKHAYDTGLNPIRLGEKHHNSKLTTSQVLEIVTHIDSGLLTFDQIAILYGVSKASIGKINTGMIRNEVTGRGVNRTSSDMRFGSCNPGAKSVLNCRGEVYSTIKEAADHYGLDASSIVKVCKGKSRSCGLYPQSKEPIKWEYKYDN